jgi:hypothetical protein
MGFLGNKEISLMIGDSKNDEQRDKVEMEEQIAN